MKLLVEKLWVRRLLSLLTLAIVWELMARFGILNPFYAPPPSEILRVVYSFFAVYSGIKDVNQLLVDRVRTLGGGRMILLREVYIPSVTAWVLGSLKVAVGFAFTGAVVGEFVAATRGLGYLLQFAQSTYNASLTLGLIFLIMAFVLLLFVCAEVIERRLLRWRYRGPSEKPA